MKITKLLNEISYSSIKEQMKQFFIDCSKKYFSDLYGKFPMPKFTSKQHTKRAGWFSSDTNEIGCIPELGDELKSIMYHETIHYYQFHTYSKIDWWQVKNGGHDDFFLLKMKEINNTEGSNLVNVYQDFNKILKTTKPIYVYGIVTSQGDYAYVWTPTPNSKIENWLTNVAKPKYKGIFMFTTDDFYFKTTQQRYSGKGMKLGIVNNPEKIKYIQSQME